MTVSCENLLGFECFREGSDGFDDSRAVQSNSPNVFLWQDHFNVLAVICLKHSHTVKDIFCIGGGLDLSVGGLEVSDIGWLHAIPSILASAQQLRPVRLVSSGLKAIHIIRTDGGHHYSSRRALEASRPADI